MQEFEAGLVTYQVPGQPGLQSNILSQNKRQEKLRRLSFCVVTDTRQNWGNTHSLTTIYPKRSEGGCKWRWVGQEHQAWASQEFKMAHSTPPLLNRVYLTFQQIPAEPG